MNIYIYIYAYIYIYTHTLTYAYVYTYIHDAHVRHASAAIMSESQNMIITIIITCYY